MSRLHVGNEALVHMFPQMSGHAVGGWPAESIPRHPLTVSDVAVSVTGTGAGRASSSHPGVAAMVTTFAAVGSCRPERRFNELGQHSPYTDSSYGSQSRLVRSRWAKARLALR